MTTLVEQVERPLFDGPEQIVRVWALGIPSGCKAIPLHPEGCSSSEQSKSDRLWRRTERYAVACAVMRRATERGLGRSHCLVMLSLLVAGRSWHQAAEDAGLDEPGLRAEACKKRVYRALKAGIRMVAREMR